nr:MAG TPA: hypothetical protein [Bacteriophage sp.]
MYLVLLRHLFIFVTDFQDKLFFRFRITGKIIISQFFQIFIVGIDIKKQHGQIHIVGAEFIGQGINFPESGRAYAAKIQLECRRAYQNTVIKVQDALPLRFKIRYGEDHLSAVEAAVQHAAGYGFQAQLSDAELAGSMQLSFNHIGKDIGPCAEKSILFIRHLIKRGVGPCGYSHILYHAGRYLRDINFETKAGFGFSLCIYIEIRENLTVQEAVCFGFRKILLIEQKPADIGIFSQHGKQSGFI